MKKKPLKQKYLHHQRKWTAKEDEYLRREWHDITPRRISYNLGRTPGAVVHRVVKLGLKRGCPQGCILLTTAIKMSGYHRDLVLEILRMYDVKMVRHRISRLTRKSSGYHCLKPCVYINEYEALEAFKKYSQKDYETANQASDRLGIRTVLLLAVAHKAKHPERRGKRVHMLPSKVWTELAKQCQPKQRENYIPWTKEMYARVQKLLDEGMSRREIAAAMGLSMGSISGAVRRKSLRVREDRRHLCAPKVREAA